MFEQDDFINWLRTLPVGYLAYLHATYLIQIATPRHTSKVKKLNLTPITDDDIDKFHNYIQTAKTFKL